MRHALAPVTALLVAALAGCGPADPTPKAVVRGRLLDNGQPFSADALKARLPKGVSLPPGAQPLQVIFLPIDRGETYFATITDPAAGTFELAGSDGKGVRLGRYKVSVQVNTGPGTPDALGGKFSPEKTAITRELKDGEEVVIDLAKP
ncbi:MAG: hypothetical protein MUF18_04520 [Fimbriiglobus sp.]|jgi:hypothetical protein|nr:hypothetical protein [Fimbriiglobus sp.]